MSDHGKKTKLFVKLLLAFIFIASIISYIWFTRTSPLSVHRSASKQQAADLLKDALNDLIEQLTQDFPADVELIKLAVRFHRINRNVDSAFKVLENGLKYKPTQYDLLYMSGMLAFNNGLYDMALEKWNNAVKIRNDNIILHENIADALILSGEYRKAADQLESAIKSLNANIETYYILGQAYLKLNELEKSKTYFQKALNINPANSQINYGLGKVYLRLKQPEKAKIHMDIYRELKQNKVDKMQLLAEKRTDSVVKDTITHELKEFPNILSGICSRGSFLYRSKQKFKKNETLLKKSEDCFQIAISLAKDHPGLRRKFVFFYLYTKKDLKKAIKHAQKAVEIEQTAQNYYLLSKVYYRRSNKEKSMEAIEKALGSDHNNLEYKRLFNQIKEMK